MGKKKKEEKKETFVYEWVLLKSIKPIDVKTYPYFRDRGYEIIDTTETDRQVKMSEK